MLSVVIPVRNGATMLDETISEVLRFLDNQAPEGELIVVSDGCSDQPDRILQPWLERDDRVRFEKLDLPTGKGAAVRHGVMIARGDRIAFLDVDLSARPEMLNRLQAALDEGVDVACGSRHTIGAMITTEQGLLRRFLGTSFRLLVQKSTDLPVLDTQCGCKAFRSDSVVPIFKEMQEMGFAFDLELLLHARRRHLEIREVPIDWADSSSSRVRPLRDGFLMMKSLLRLLLLDRAAQKRTGT